MSINQVQESAIRHLLSHCGSIKAKEKVLLIVDLTTKHLVGAFQKAAVENNAILDVVEIPVADRHGKEPPQDVAIKMETMNLVMGFTKMSLAHTKARLNLNAKGGRYLSLPGYSYELLTDPCVQADYHSQLKITQTITDAYTKGSIVRVKTKKGTDITLGIKDRVGNCCPGFVNDQYNLGSPPDIESNVSPVEHLSEGIAVIDGSVACDEIGLLEVPVILTIKEGRVVDVKSERSDYVEKVNHLFSRINNPKAYILAECGIGLNPLAKLTGNMLTDEGAMGCVHFGFGSNITVGGMNDVPFHTDFIMRDASLWIDDQQILNEGKPCL